MEFKPIRVIADITINAGTRERAERNYPHGTITCVTPKYGRHLPAYSVSYYKPQRIDAPTPEERRVLLGAQSGEGRVYALEIPQSKELKCDDPKSPLSGSRMQSERRRRKARLEELNREDERKLEAKKQEPVPEPEPEPEKKKSKRSYRKKITEDNTDE